MAKITFLPQNAEVSVREGISVLQAAAAAGISIDGNCAGKKTCGKCKVKIKQGDLSYCVDPNEKLSAVDRAAGYRLACCHRVSDGMVIEIPEAETTADRKKKLIRLPEGFQKNTAVQKICIQVRRTTLEEQESMDHSILKLLSLGKLAFRKNVLQKLPHILKEQEKITLTVLGREIIDVECGDRVDENYGVAVDIGTTTVLVMLWNLSTGQMAAIRGITNPQGSYGADVISRISYIDGDEEKLTVLKNAISEGINNCIQEFEKERKISHRNIYNFTVVGNTTMSHIFMGVDPSQLAKIPFAPVFTGSGDVAAAELGLMCHENASVYRAANIAGHVGSDITAGILTTDIVESKRKKLFIDIGTNGELVISGNGRTLTCSTAAGPAFEGSSIRQGMRAAKGAIERVDINEKDVEISVIGGCKPIGICGSGIIDAVGELVRKKIVNENGRIRTAGELKECGMSDRIADRVRQDESGKKYFVLYFDEDGKEDVSITQKDIREVQLAKGAIYAGITIMMNEIGISADELERISIAGAFGSYIRKQSAIHVGLLPEIDESRIISLGNSAGIGAAMLLLSTDYRAEADRAAEMIEHIELANRPEFQKQYMASMKFK